MGALGCFGLIVVLTILVVAIVALSLYLEKKRRDALEALAQELSFTFQPGADTALLSKLSVFELFNRGDSRKMSNLLRGKTNDLEINIFDYQFMTGSGTSRTTWTFSVFVARRSNLKLPQFSLSPENIFHKIGGLFGFQDIDFASHPRFSSRYLLRGPDEEAIRNLFQPQVLDWFESHLGLSIEAKDDTIVFARRPLLAASKIRDFLAEGFEILKQFESVAMR